MMGKYDNTYAFNLSNSFLRNYDCNHIKLSGNMHYHVLIVCCHGFFLRNERWQALNKYQDIYDIILLHPFVTHVLLSGSLQNVCCHGKQTYVT